MESEAVVITGFAPILSATRHVHAFAFPICPDKSDITFPPMSSTTNTAGSDFLSFINGAIFLTAIPHAPTKTSKSQLTNWVSTQSDKSHSKLWNNIRARSFVVTSSIPAALLSSIVSSQIFSTLSFVIALLSRACFIISEILMPNRAPLIEKVTIAAFS